MGQSSPIRFFMLFMLVLISLFALELLSITQEQIIMPWTHQLAVFSSWLVELFDQQAIVQGNVLRDSVSGFAVSIQPGCNGVEATIVLIAAIVAFPSSWLMKFWGIILGFVAIQSLNVLRIISLFYIGQWNTTLFEWAHLYVWQALIMLDVLIVFIIWLRSLQQQKRGQQTAHVQ